jgi:molecular chaperone GrpE
MPFIKEEMKKKDEVILEDMKQAIDAAESDDKEVAEEAPVGEENIQQVSAEELLQQKVEDLQAAVQEKDERVKRLQADFENFRRRTRQEKEELSAVVTQTLLTDMLPLLDNFERAMAVEAKDMESFQTGVEMIYKQLKAALEKNGLETIDTTDTKFDPNFHQAVMRVQNPEKEDDSIAAELQKGYMVKGRVIRPSMVQVVSN